MVLTVYFFLEDNMAAAFPFSDLRSFKDFVVFVQTYLPDRFRPREGVGPADQWSMELAFDGLRLGLRMAVEEKGERADLVLARSLVDEAYSAYRDGQEREGFFKLDELTKTLRKIPSR